MNEHEPILTGRMKNAPKVVRDYVADMMIDAILSTNIPKESKIEVQIMKAYRDVRDVLEDAFRGYSCPIPQTEEGKEVQERIYPARKEFLEYLQLMKAGLDSFLVANPIPDIPPKFRRAVEQMGKE